MILSVNIAVAESCGDLLSVGSAEQVQDHVLFLATPDAKNADRNGN